MDARLDKFCLQIIFQVNRETFSIQIFSYTKAEWLDIVEIEFRPGQFSGTEGFVSFPNIALYKYC